MNAFESGAVWVEMADRSPRKIDSSCSLGRSSSNQIVLPDEKVSRRHALIHVQETDEFWLVDLGSRNGTYLNGRRITQPSRLRNRDSIEIARFRLVFRQPGSEDEHGSDSVSEKTVQDIGMADCWLLVADIEDSTQLVQRMSAEEVPVVTGHWLDRCRQLVDQHGGSINKFLGDGFFAYWRNRPETERSVADAMNDLAKLRGDVDLAFRIVVHFGNVFTGGGASMGEESLLGQEVNFVFRMEKLAGLIGQPVLFSQPASEALAKLIDLDDAGTHGLSGFEGQYQFYALRPTGLAHG